MADWARVNKIRRTVEAYYQRNDKNIDYPRFDLFVTEVRRDWENAGFNCEDAEDVYKMWAALAMTCAATAHMLEECKTREQMQGALAVMGTYGNMTGLFLREMTKYVDAPAIEEDAK